MRTESAPFTGLRSRRRLVLGLLALAIGASAMAGPLGLFGPKGDSKTEQRDSVQRDSKAMLNELFAAKPELRDRIKKAAGYATFKQTNVHLLLVASSNGYGVLVDQSTGKPTYMRVASIGGGLGMGVKDLRVIFVFNDAKVMRQFVEQGWQFGTDADATAKYENTGVAAEQTTKAAVNFEEGTVAADASGRAVAKTGSKTGSNTGTTSDGKSGTSSTSKDPKAASQKPSDKKSPDQKSDPKAAAPTGTTGARGPIEIYQFTESGISLQATVSGTKYWKDAELNK
jgi:lipid-binding SYLF domain-containing protein